MFKAIVFDHDWDSLQITLELMKNNRYLTSVIGFSTPQALFNELEKGNIDIAFIRVGKPGISGLSLVRKIQQRLPAVRLVFMADTRNYAVMAFEEGACGYLILPIRTEYLTEVIENILQRRRWKGG